MDKLTEYGIVAGIAAIVSPVCSVAIAAIRGWAGARTGIQASVSVPLEQAIITIAQQTETQTELLRQIVRTNEESGKALARIEVKIDRGAINGQPRNSHH